MTRNLMKGYRDKEAVKKIIIIICIYYFNGYSL